MTKVDVGVKIVTGLFERGSQFYSFIATRPPQRAVKTICVLKHSGQLLTETHPIISAYKRQEQTNFINWHFKNIN